jgi:hypothetical protein
MAQLKAVIQGAKRMQRMSGGKVGQYKAMKLNSKGLGNAI